jgi:tryptophan-rich sensory protein
MITQIRNKKLPPMQMALYLLGFLVVTFTISAIGGFITSGSVSTWYPMLTKPPLIPPPWVFAPVWTTLYTMMAIAAWLVFVKAGFKQAKTSFQLYFIQLVFNLGWSIIFFGLKCPFAAFVHILLLWGFILATIISFFRISKLAGVLMIPYLLWVTFASYLNVGIWLMK